MMLIDSKLDNIGRINNKKELLGLLKRYKEILNSEIVDYLNSLVNLEFSVVRNYISEDKRAILSETDIYNKIARYNIYKRAIELFKRLKDSSIIVMDDKKHNDLDVYYYLNDNYCFSLFKFNYNESVLSSRLANECKIGEVNFFKTNEDKQLREDEIVRIKERLESLYRAKKPYPLDPDDKRIGGHVASWYSEHDEAIIECERRLRELTEKVVLSDDDKRKIEITNKIYNMLLDDYGISNDDFIEDKNNLLFLNKAKFKKVLVKKLPNLIIKSDIDYI